MKYQLNFRATGTSNTLNISKLFLAYGELDTQDVMVLKNVRNIHLSGEIDFDEGDVVMIDDDRGSFVYHILGEEMKEIGRTDNFSTFREAEEILKRQKDLETKRRMKEIYGDNYSADRV